MQLRAPQPCQQKAGQQGALVAADREAEDAWVAHCGEVAAQTLVAPAQVLPAALGIGFVLLGAFCVDQAVSNNLYLPGDVDLWDLHNLHFQAWEKGVKSLYYCRSRSVQRADRVTHVAGEMPQPEQAAKEVDYDECLSCQ